MNEERDEYADVELYCEHIWVLIEESVDHAFGTEVRVWEECECCGLTRDAPPPRKPGALIPNPDPPEGDSW